METSKISHINRYFLVGELSDRLDVVEQLAVPFRVDGTDGYFNSDNTGHRIDILVLKFPQLHHFLYCQAGHFE